MKTLRLLTTLACATTILCGYSQKFELLKYGDMDHWITRDVKESRVIGGKTKQVYGIGADAHLTGDAACRGISGSPWATSNVVAKVAGVTKTSNAVSPAAHTGNGRCACLTTKMESCKALGIINIDVMVAGSMFLGKMLEPIKSTSDPYAKMEMGVPFTKRPAALVYDYELEMPATDSRTYSSGFSKKRTLKGHDNAEVFIYLQRRWEDADGNIYAKRVGTGRELLTKSTGGWKTKHQLKVNYGDITKMPGYRSYMGLIPDAKSYYARNSRGEMVPVHEVGWDSPDATPTHLMVMFSSGSGEPYVGTPGLTLRVDNVGLAY